MKYRFSLSRTFLIIIFTTYIFGSQNQGNRNLNPILSPFGNCLINIIYFQGLDVDFIEFKIPVVLANYYFNKIEWRLEWGTVNGKIIVNEKYIEFAPYSWQCLVHLFLFPLHLNRINSDADHIIPFPSSIRWFWNRYIINGIQDDIFRTEMFVIILEDHINEKDSLLQNWLMIALYEFIITSQNHFKFLLISDSSYKLKVHLVSKYEFHTYFSDKIDKWGKIMLKKHQKDYNKTVIDDEISSINKLNIFNSPWYLYKWEFINGARLSGNFDILKEQLTLTEKITFKQFHEHKYSATIAIFNLIAPNTSFYRFTTEHILIPTVEFNYFKPNFFTIKSETFKFVTCDGVKGKEGISFKSYFSSFDTITWILILFSCIFISLILKLIFRVKEIKKIQY